jgi:hypothetical protein
MSLQNLGNGQRTSRRVQAFLCHNSQDKPTVTRVAKRLEKEGIFVWYDKTHLMPGSSWQEEVEFVIAETQGALVFIGPHGPGPWENREMRSLLSEFVRRGIAIIPVYLPGSDHAAPLPIFLREFTWVDLRNGLKRENVDRLIWGITRKKPAGV